MHEIKTTAGLAKPEAYRALHVQLAAVLAGESDGLANTANMAALLYQALPGLNWAGFYSLWVQYPGACSGLDGWEDEGWRAGISISRIMSLC